MVHYGHTDEVLAARQQTLLAAYHTHPERFVRKPPQPPVVPRQAWINPPVETRVPEEPLIVTPAMPVLESAH